MSKIKFRVVECIFFGSSEKAPKIQTHKGNLTEAKARAMADRLNAKQDKITDDVIRNYHTEQA